MKNYERILYLREMGMNDKNIKTDLQNHRVRVLENIDIFYKGEKYNLFFEFLQGTHRTYRTTNKRTGEPLKKAVIELIKDDALCIDTQYEVPEVSNGYVWHLSYRLGTLEREVYNKHLYYTRNNVLNVVNRYAVEKFTRVVLVEEETKKIISRIGGYREKSILENDPYFTVSETWNNDHKIVTVTERIKTETGRSPMGYVTYSYKDGNSCSVDLVTGRITG